MLARCLKSRLLVRISVTDCIVVSFYISFTFHFTILVSISLDSPPTVSESSPKVRVRVSDLLGNSLGKMDVVVESAMRQTDGAVILANSKMTPASEDGLFEIDMLAAKPGNKNIQYFISNKNIWYSECSKSLGVVVWILDYVFSSSKIWTDDLSKIRTLV